MSSHDVLSAKGEGSRRARVFISCGQSKHSSEIETARNIARRLGDMGFLPYIAVEEQSLRGLTENIYRQLSESEYLVFVDFKREKLVPRDQEQGIIDAKGLQNRGSLFSHQELAIASFLGIELLAFQEKGVKPDDGIIRFLQANAIPFSDRELLPSVVADQVRQRGWNPTHGMNLLLNAKPDNRWMRLYREQRSFAASSMSESGTYIATKRP